MSSILLTGAGSTRSGGAAVDPIESIPGLVLRYQSWNPEIFLNSGGSPAEDLEEVKDILDLSPEGVVTTQPTLAKQAIWAANVINGHGALWFDETDDGYGTDCSLHDDYTIYLVTNTELSGGIRSINSGETNKLISMSRSNAAVYLGAAVVSDLSANADEWCIGVLRVSTAGTVSSFRLNGVDVTENPAVAADWFTVTLGAVGAVPEPLAGLFAAAGAFSRAITDAEAEIVEEYLSAKTGIVLG